MTVLETPTKTRKGLSPVIRMNSLLVKKGFKEIFAHSRGTVFFLSGSLPFRRATCLSSRKRS